MQNRFYSFKWNLFLILFGLGLASCQQDSTLPETGNGTAGTVKKQWVNFYIGGNSVVNAQVRALPPGMEDGQEFVGTCQVNEVALMVFRRKEGTTDPFFFDVDNSTVFDVDGRITGARALTEITDVSGSDKNMKQTQGTFQKEKGYEYRVFALGYNTQRVDVHPIKIKEIDEREDFRIVDREGKGISATTTLDEVKLQLVKRNFSDLSSWMAERDYRGSSDTDKINNNITGYWVRTPEIFYGTCTTSTTGQEIITFNDENQVTGILHRGVAQVTVNIERLSDIPSWGRHVCEFSLMIDSLRTEVNLDSYNRFVAPQTPLLSPLPNFGSNANSDNFMTFTAVTGEDQCMKDSDNIALTFFVLPTITQMRTRYATDSINKFAYEAYIAVNAQSDGNQATGVIDPSASGKKFYFRRNHKYVINGNGEDIAANDENK